MTAVETTTEVVPPVSYPSESWLPEADFFHVSEDLRAFYAADAAKPTKAQHERLHSTDLIGPATVDTVIVEPTGRHRRADPVDRGEAAGRGLLSRWRYPQTQVDPYADSMAMRVWEHEIRLDNARKARSSADIHALATASRPHCQSCGTTAGVDTVYGVFTKGGQLCGQCAAAIELDGALNWRAGHEHQIRAFRERH